MSNTRDFVQLLRGSAPAPGGPDEETRLYADVAGVLRTVQHDGTDVSVAGAKSSVVDISSAEILALNGAPIEVVPAQGSGTAIVPFSFASQYTHVSAAYVLAADVFYYYDTDTSVLCNVGVDLTLTHSQFAPFGGRPLVQDFGGTAISFAEDQAIMLTAGTSDPTTGDGSLRSVIQYFVFELA